MAALAAGRPVSAQPSDSTGIWPDGPAVEAFLREAQVVDRHRIGTGVTNPEKAKLEKEGVTRFAVLKQVDKPSDNWSYEVAAYELDKLLHPGHVPPTVARSLRGRRACLQLWVESFRDERKLLNNLNMGASGTHVRYWFARVPETKGYAVTYPDTLVHRLRAVTDDEIEKAIGRSVPGEALRRLLKRRQLIIERLGEIPGAG
jgi:hypothetical protein